MFEHKQAVGSANLLDFMFQRGRDLARSLVGDDRNPLVPLEAETDLNRIPSPGKKLGIYRNYIDD
jgi:hypothetical protein